MRILLKLTGTIVLLLFFTLLLLELALSVWYKSDIVDRLKTLADNGLHSSMYFEDIGISALHHFPHLTISINNLSVKESGYEILRSERITLQADLLDLFHENYSLSKVEILNPQFFAPIDSTGKKFRIRAKAKSQNENQNVPKLLLDIPEIQIIDAVIIVQNEYKKNRVRISVDEGTFQLKSFDDLLEFKGNAVGVIDTLISKGTLKQTAVPIAAKQTTFRFNTLDNRKLFDGMLHLHDAQLRAYGLLKPTGNGNLLDITLEGDEARINDYLTLIPQFRPLKLIQLNPDAKLTLTIRNSGFVDPVTFPNVDILFHLENATFSRIGVSGIIDSVNFRGHFSNGKERNAKTSEMVIDFGRAKIDDSFFEINGSIQNFDDPYIDIDAQSMIELEDVNGVMGIPDLEMSGTILFLADIHGRLSELEKKYRSKKHGFNGQIEFKDVWMNKKSANIKIENLNSKIYMKNTKLTLSNLQMKFNDALVRMYGQTNNFIPLVEQSHGKTSNVKLNVNIENLALSEENLGRNKSSNKNRSEQKNFEFPKFLSLDCDVAINQLSYEKYKAKSASFNLALNKDSFALTASHFTIDEGDFWIKALSKSSPSNFNEYEVWVEAKLNELDTKKYWPLNKDKSGQIEPNKRPIYSNWIVHTDLSLKKLKHSNFELSNIRVFADLKKGYLDAKTINFSFPFGRTKSSLNVHLLDSTYQLHGTSNVALKAFNVDSLKNYYNRIKPISGESDTLLSSKSKSLSIKDFSINVTAPKAAYHHFEAKKLNANIKISDNRARLNQSSFDMFDGSFDLSGLIRRNENLDVKAFCDISASNINLGKITAEFGGANSEMFSEQHFRGNVGVNGQVLLEYNKELIHQEDKLLGKINISLSDGEMINFKPITESLKFIKQANRDTILLANPNLEILIHNDEVLLPMTTFKTSLSNIDFFGYHSSEFDFGFDLQISVADLLFKSQKKKRAQVKNKKETSIGAIKHHLQARTVNGRMQIESMKKKEYKNQLHKLEQRYMLVDSMLNQMSIEVIQ
ncbi:MAG: hypothetical protein ABJH98_19575 [Reichenbachiella sp.]|uniref:hypothetical protein n=1 Tax=Reichenbachiella sp. TaxID=2184521 RepID=UPI0032991925